MISSYFFTSLLINSLATSNFCYVNVFNAMETRLHGGLGMAKWLHLPLFVEKTKENSVPFCKLTSGDALIG